MPLAKNFEQMPDPLLVNDLKEASCKLIACRFAWLICK